jgi:hypothetical protein
VTARIARPARVIANRRDDRTPGGILDAQHTYGQITAEQRRAAVRSVARMSTDAADCALLLDALGLDPAEGLAS